jgi:LysR family transcriptional regulator, transcriptional activator of the cysJI operon
MDIRKIEAFAKVYEHCSFSKAGKSLYLSQPTISAHVASLEQELEVQLFDRIGRSVVPTKAGEVLYEHARKIFEASELAISELRKLQDRITGKLDIGGSTIPANFIMPEILAKFWTTYPEVIMDLRIGDSEDIVTQVRDNTLMLGVVGAVFESPELQFEKIASDSLILTMTPKLYESHRHLPVEELLRALPWVLREEGSGTRVAMAESLSKFGIDIHSLRAVIMVRNAGAMSRCLSAGMGASITSAITVQERA